VLELVAHGARVYMASRSEARATAAIKRLELDLAARGKEIGSGGTGEVKFLHCDLATIAGSRKSAEDFLSKETRLDVLINNAGALGGPFELGPDGLSTVIGPNHFGTYTFTTTLLPLLTKTSQLPGADVRIVTVSSFLGLFIPPKDLKLATVEDVNQPYGSEGFLASNRRYAVSKLANILFTKELQSRLDAQSSSIIALALHPGIVATEGYQNAASETPGIAGLIGRIVGAIASIPSSKGAATTLFAAASPKVRADPATYKGAFLMPYEKVKVAGGLAQNKQLAADLWALSEKLVGQ